MLGSARSSDLMCAGWTMSVKYPFLEKRTPSLGAQGPDSKPKPRLPIPGAGPVTQPKEDKRGLSRGGAGSTQSQPTLPTSPSAANLFRDR